MRCTVNTSEGDKHIFNFSRQDKVSKIKKLIADKLEVSSGSLRLIYLGKQLENNLTLYDYNVKDNSSILAFIKKSEKQLSEEGTESATISEERKVVSSAEGSDKNKESNEEKPTIGMNGNVTTIDEDGNTIHIDASGNKVVIPMEEEECKECDNKVESECKECGCHECGKKSSEELILICDECQYYFHTFCLPIPLDSIPEGDWYCHKCYNDPNLIIKAGEASKIKAKKDVGRKWDNGMACAALSKKCTIVKSDHIGSIPGIPVGSLFRYRINLSESGVHRPPVAGIQGSSKSVAYSIVLGGGYEDDKDFGEYFYYTGAGGRDLSGNKRTANQSFDQVLEKSNLALANTLKRPINKKDGDASPDWKKSSPVRVSRSYKLAKESKFAPSEGFRYDGLYKLVRYWPQRGDHGFIVWRYEFRRDDDEPAPWTPEGKKRIKELGITMIGPSNDEIKAKNPKSKAKSTTKGKKKKGHSKIDDEEEVSEVELSDEGHILKKLKATKVSKTLYKPSQDIINIINTDTLNIRTWQKILKQEFQSMTEFLEAIMSKEFICPICHDIVLEPISTRCGHNACKGCMKNSLLNYGNKCPYCKTILYPEIDEMGKQEGEDALKELSKSLSVNEMLVNVLKRLVSSYGS